MKKQLSNEEQEAIFNDKEVVKAHDELLDNLQETVEFIEDSKGNLVSMNTIINSGIDDEVK